MTMKVAVLGLGIMGSGMARQLVEHGFDVTVWNRDADKARALATAGAQVAVSPAQAAQDADVVVAMLANDEASRTVWLGEDGALAAMSSASVAIEASTLTIDWVRALAAEAATRGVAFLDAPVTGSKSNAANGSLTFLAGGDTHALQVALPVLEAMSSGIVHLGPSGSGALLKLINNFLCGVQVASLAEAIAMIEASGLDVARSVGVLGAGAPGSPLVRAVSERMLERAYEPNFLVPLMAKDLEYALAAFADQGIDLKTASAARSRFMEADRAGFSDRDIAAIVEPLRSAAASRRHRSVG